MRTKMLQERIQRKLEASGLRATLVRRSILELLLEANRHYTPEELLEELRLRGEPISIATLYQNLRQLVEKGLLRKVTGPDGLTRYDANIEPHHHLVCIRCGRMIDVALEGFKAELRPTALPTTTDEELDRWQVLEPHVELEGICPECQIDKH
jgi:Fe2+ or Zn2+ uptake regulation protein